MNLGTVPAVHTSCTSICV